VADVKFTVAVLRQIKQNKMLSMYVKDLKCSGGRTCDPLLYLLAVYLTILYSNLDYTASNEMVIDE
jgi:hypothetical protein